MRDGRFESRLAFLKNQREKSHVSIGLVLDSVEAFIKNTLLPYFSAFLVSRSVQKVNDHGILASKTITESGHGPAYLLQVFPFPIRWQLSGGPEAGKYRSTTRDMEQ